MTTDQEVNRQIIPGTEEEVWVSQIPGQVHVTKTNWNGQPISAKTHGKGDILRITARDRVAAQERVKDPNADPFTNGMLRRQDADQQADPTTASDQAIGDEDLTLFFELEQDDFEAEVSKLNEINTRRLKAMMDDEGNDISPTVKQANFVQRHIAENFAVGGDTPTYREMQRDGDSA